MMKKRYKMDEIQKLITEGIKFFFFSSCISFYLFMVDYVKCIQKENKDHAEYQIALFLKKCLYFPGESECV